MWKNKTRGPGHRATKTEQLEDEDKLRPGAERECLDQKEETLVNEVSQKLGERDFCKRLCWKKP